MKKLNNYLPLPSFLYIKDSDIHGQGLFTKEAIKKGTILGDTHIKITLLRLFYRTPLGGFYNHSTAPNCIKRRQSTALGHKFYLETLRDIEAGEELTVTYTLYNPLSDE